MVEWVQIFSLAKGVEDYKYEDEDDDADEEDDKASKLSSGSEFQGTWDTEQF